MNDKPNHENEPEDEIEDFDFPDSIEELSELFWSISETEPSFPTIPLELTSSYSDGPFEICIECGVNLMENGCNYVIQKSRRNGETVLEMAICSDCAGNMDGQISEESKIAIEDYLSSLSPKADSITEGQCIGCDSMIDQDQADFEIVGMARGPYLLSPAIVFCHSCQEKFEELLSEETKKGGQDFIDKNFPGVPENMGLPVGFFSM